MAASATRPRLKERYEKEIRPALIERFGYTTPMQAPVIRKITLNMGVGDAKQDSKVIDAATEQLATIAGQRPSVRRARKSIAAFKLREGMPVACRDAARRAKLRVPRPADVGRDPPDWRLPRMNPRSFDGRGNYSMGVREQIIFPEIDYDTIDQTRGLDITITTSARSDAEALALLEAFGFRSHAGRAPRGRRRDCPGAGGGPRPDGWGRGEAAAAVEEPQTAVASEPEATRLRRPKPAVAAEASERLEAADEQSLRPRRCQEPETEPAVRSLTRRWLPRRSPRPGGAGLAPGDAAAGGAHPGEPGVEERKTRRRSAPPTTRRRRARPWARKVLMRQAPRPSKLASRSNNGENITTRPQGGPGKVQDPRLQPLPPCGRARRSTVSSVCAGSACARWRIRARSPGMTKSSW